MKENKTASSKHILQSPRALLIIAVCLVGAGSWIGYSVGITQCDHSSLIRHTPPVEPTTTPASTTPTPTATTTTKPAQEVVQAPVKPPLETPEPNESSPPPPVSTPAPVSEKTQSSEGICTDTCKKAKDGQCDDGSVLLTKKLRHEDGKVEVFCDPGTDCSDCGPWKGPTHSPSWTLPKPPIEFLRDRGVTVFVKHTSNTPSFIMPYTDHKQDIDVSGSMEYSGQVEPAISAIFQAVLQKRCNPKDPSSSALFVDVGANFGWFSFLSASLGCRVVAWEPVPTFRAFLEYGLQINDFQKQVQVRTAVVGATAGQKLKMVVPNRGIWGTAGVDGINIDPGIKNDGPLEELLLDSETLDTVVDEPVELLKVDVEGYEPYVMKGAAKLMSQHVQNVVMEYTPGVQERHSNWAEHVKNPYMLMDMLAAGFQIGHIANKHHAITADSLPPFSQITEEGLKYDIQDSQKLQNGTMGCNPVVEQLPPNKRFLNCNAIPMALHPYSFRSSFWYNTNIWATKNRSIQPKGPREGTFPPGHPLTSWTVPRNQELGTGGAICRDGGDDVKVLFRCPCVKMEVCGEMERLAQQLAAEGKLPF